MSEWPLSALDVSLQEHRHYCCVLRAARHPAGDHLSDGTLGTFLGGVGAPPESRLVFQVVNVTGNQDICFYNFLCAHPLGALRWVGTQVAHSPLGPLV